MINAAPVWQGLHMPLRCARAIVTHDRSYTRVARIAYGRRWFLHGRGKRL